MYNVSTVSAEVIKVLKLVFTQGPSERLFKQYPPEGPCPVDIVLMVVVHITKQSYNLPNYCKSIAIDPDLGPTRRDIVKQSVRLPW